MVEARQQVRFATMVDELGAAAADAAIDEPARTAAERYSCGRSRRRQPSRGEMRSPVYSMTRRRAGMSSAANTPQRCTRERASRSPNAHAEGSIRGRCAGPPGISTVRTKSLTSSAPVRSRTATSEPLATKTLAARHRATALAAGEDRATAATAATERTASLAARRIATTFATGWISSRIVPP